MAAQEVLLLDSDDEAPITKKLNSSKDPESSDSSIEIQEPKVRRKIVWQCLEPDCVVNRKKDLITADSYALSYYNISNNDKKKRKICLTCNGRLKSQQSRLVEKLNKRQLLLDELLPVPRECVTLDDSDEKSETDESVDTDFEIDLSSDDGLTPEQRIEKVLNNYTEQIDLEGQVTDSIKELSKRMDDLENDRLTTNQKFDDLEKEIDQHRRDLYKDFEPVIKNLPPLDIPSVTIAPKPTSVSPKLNKSVHSSPHPRPDIGQVKVIASKPIDAQAELKLPFVPAQGILERPHLTIGVKVYYLRGQSALHLWKEGEVDEVHSDGDLINYKIKFYQTMSGKRVMQTKYRNLKQLAYYSPAKVKIPVGTRCIGLYSENTGDKGAYYAGIIAEPPKGLNLNRYLVFFDDGVARYIIHNDLRVVCQMSVKVAEDIHPNSKEFINKYLTQYPERPMVKLNVGQVVKTEFEGKWHITRVKSVDASLVMLTFEQDNRTEWIYRGSTRLGPLFTELENQKLRREQGTNQMQRRQRGTAMPMIEYTRQDNVDADGAPPAKKQNVARKSMGNRGRSDHSNNVETAWDREGKITPVNINTIRSYGVAFRKHACSERCIDSPKYKYVEKNLKDNNPLLIPLIVGFDRQVTRVSTSKPGGTNRRKNVTYTAPCGRRLRNLDEVHRYLRITKNELEIDFFNFDWFISVFGEWSPVQIMNHIPDLSYSHENVKIPCVNSTDNRFPEYVEYKTKRIPKDKVFINTDKEFLIGCECVDDCQEKEKCACQQLTISSAYDASGKLKPAITGYKFRRLDGLIPSGIYECNPTCRCAKTCLNKVAQHPLRNKLQVFLTSRRGWGVRTLYDIPKGAFICIYVGNLFESEEGNKQGQNFGDEYFADLDLIEIVEEKKDGYESDVTEPKINEEISTEEEDDTSGEKSNDKEYNPKLKSKVKMKSRNTDRASRSKMPQIDGNISSSCSESEESSQSYLKSRSEVTHINDLIFKPDPFKYNMVRKQQPNQTESDGPLEVLVQHPSQVDGVGDSSEDDMEILEEKRPQRSGFTATEGILGPEKPKKTFKSTRKFFGVNEEAYIMDAKSIGNIGRYLNHSCGPNCFVQSVFVDTHDLRFPWVAFFSLGKIDAGSELCWDYNYQIGTVDGKEMTCECGAENCRGRLL